MIMASNGNVMIEGKKKMCLGELGTIVISMLEEIDEEEVLVTIMTAFNHEEFIKDPDKTMDAIMSAIKRK